MRRRISFGTFYRRATMIPQTLMSQPMKSEEGLLRLATAWCRAVARANATDAQSASATEGCIVWNECEKA